MTNADYHTNMSNANSISGSSDYWCDLTFDEEALQSALDAPLHSPNKSQLHTGEQYQGFDSNVGEMILYPSNLPERSYQLSIIKASLFNNTLVVLPTGLGKTFIAAVVMYNIYRWYPTSKIIFMAPTRPLVAQQIEACQRVMPFPDEDTIELTGRLHRNSRKEIWKTKRVFFATPQVVLSDIIGDDDSNFPFRHVKLIVVDEAHRAKGRYAYTEVVQAIKNRNDFFRVVALSATPGRTMEDIAEVVQNLFISHIEVRCDSSEDVLPYVHKRHMKTVVVQLGNNLKELYDEILTIIDPYLRKLICANVLGGSLKNISRNFLLFEQKRFRENSQNQQHPERQLISSSFSFCISMHHALELLERHGIRVFLNYFEENEDGRCKYVINMEPKVRQLLDRLRDQFGPDSFEVSKRSMVNGENSKIPDKFDFGHPKFEQARTCLLQHFQTNPNTRAIVFCEYRESVMLIYRLLLQHEPLLKPRYFVGQGSTTGSLCSLTQKQQIQIMDDFRCGKCNILIATSIGEEGIDVGEVELIVCFDINTSNPQRFIQRIGRTGRKKQGHVVVLVTEGREQQIFKDVLAQKDLINARMLHSITVKKSLYKNSPRLVPIDIDPKVFQIFIKPRKLKETNKSVNSKNGTKKMLGNQDLRTFFKGKVRPNINTLFTDPSQHGLETQQNLEKCLRKIDDYFSAFEDPVSSNTQLLSETTCSKTGAHKLNPGQEISLYNSQRFRSLKRVLEKNSPLISPKELITNPIEQLKSSKISNDGKRFILRTQPYIVKDVLEKMKLLDILPLNPDEMSDEEKDIRHLCDIITKLLGDNLSSVEMFIDDANIESLGRKRSYRPPSDYDLNDSEYTQVCNAIFNGLEEPGLLYDNFDYIQEELKKTKFYEESYSKPEIDDYQPVSYSQLRKDTNSMVYETVIFDEEAEISRFGESSINVESTCQDNCLWNEFTINAGNKSTPVQTPLVKAFQRQILNSGKQSYTMVKSLQLADENLTAYNSENKSSDIIILSDTSTEEYQLEQQTLINDRSKKTEPNCTLPNLNKCSNECKSITFTNEFPKRVSSLSKSTLNDLHVNINDFLKPFPEEILYEEFVDNTPTLNSKIDDNKVLTDRPLYSSSNNDLSQKENVYTSNLNRNSEILSSYTPKTSPKRLPIEAKQYEKQLTPFAPLQKEAIDFLNTSTNANPNLEMLSPNRPITPPERLSTHPEQYEKSPTLYELFLQNVKRRKGNLPEHIQHSVAFAEKQVRKALCLSTTDDEPFLPTNISDNENSTMSSFKTSKCKDISSSDSGERIEKTVGSETDCEELIETQIPAPYTKSISNEHSDSTVINTKTGEGYETECEEITETQEAVNSFCRQRQKRNRLNNFIDYEATVSGDESEDEYNEMPCSQYVKDSMIVSSDELETLDENAPTSSQMQAHYLQSIKSPKPIARGAFKIPAFREYNDHSQIYSQMVSIEPSQYICDSFVVDEEDDKEYIKSKNETLSPLERAERILKKQQRVRKKFKNVAQIKKRKRIRQISDSSDDDYIPLN
ncbi:uncharacterized protein LOC105213472 isoform X1 [Zeugodacus cucurbitae]|nr:uncharacterized protein LOC105213472 isoform X1 [Zeugodacus cucurbitae]